MRDAFDSFLYRHWPRSFLLGLLGLFVAYGLWWLAADVSVRTYPQRVANTIPVPPGVELVDMQYAYTRECKGSGITQYFTTDKPWETILAYYTTELANNWQPAGDDLKFYRHMGEFEQLIFSLHHIELTSEGKPKDLFMKQNIFKGLTAYSIQVTYNQDLRISRTLCRPDD